MSYAPMHRGGIVKNRVLIIESDHQVGGTVQSMVEASGHACVCVNAANAALTALSREPFDVVLTSTLYASTLRMIPLPWLAKQVQPGTAVVFTAAGQPLGREMPNAIDAFLPKPFSVQGLAHTMAGLPRRQDVVEAIEPVLVAESF
jgi:DNA-binding NtrC family response regulator